MTFKDLSKVVKDFMFDFPFYGHLLMKMRKTISTEVPTAGVAIDPESLGVDLYVNPEFFGKLTREQRRGVLHHETLHVAFGHLQLQGRFPNKELANIAMDMEINQYIPDTDLPEGLIDRRKEPFKEFNFAPKKGSKFYYDAISNEMDKNPNFKQEMEKMMKADRDGQNHGTWTQYDDLSDAQKQMFDNQQEYDLKEAFTDTDQKSKGDLPGGLQRKLDKLFEKKPEVFDWKSWFRKFIGTVIDIQRKKTPKRESKRFSGLPGLKTKRRVKVFVSVDTSGSMGQKEIADVFEQIHYIWKAGADIFVVTWDTVIHDKFYYDGKPPEHVNGGGGSDISMVIREYNKHKKDYTAAIHLTDGYISNSERLYGRHLFVITSEGQKFDACPSGSKNYKMFQIPKSPEKK